MSMLVNGHHGVFYMQYINLLTAKTC